MSKIQHPEHLMNSGLKRDILIPCFFSRNPQGIATIILDLGVNISSCFEFDYLITRYYKGHEKRRVCISMCVLKILAAYLDPAMTSSSCNAETLGKFVLSLTDLQFNVSWRHGGCLNTKAIAIAFSHGIFRRNHSIFLHPL